jgi:hypothetical protein
MSLYSQHERKQLILRENKTRQTGRERAKPDLIPMMENSQFGQLMSHHVPSPPNMTNCPAVENTQQMMRFPYQVVEKTSINTLPGNSLEC